MILEELSKLLDHCEAGAECDTLRASLDIVLEDSAAFTNLGAQLRKIPVDDRDANLLSLGHLIAVLAMDVMISRAAASKAGAHCGAARRRH